MSPEETTRAPTQVKPAQQPKLDAVGIRWDATPIPSGAPPVTILGSLPRHSGGFRLNG